QLRQFYTNRRAAGGRSPKYIQTQENTLTTKTGNINTQKEESLSQETGSAAVELSTFTQVFQHTFKDPKPSSVQPARGPAAGGTVITIRGQDLDTASKDDVSVRVGTVPCEVMEFGSQITCKTGKYPGQKVPSDPLTVRVSYGRNTTKDVLAAYQYSENPKITDYYPRDSFQW
ncbi:plexin-B2-like, partial [Plectropomus leopardus]|uniref:plexin-B2-like n=1 Tax=Plectropomus leopardus TaxID=160734 RepID=UPI001C4BB2D2